MGYDWDPDKDRGNRRKHGIGFDAMVDWDWTLSVLADTRWIDDEERELSLGPLGDRLFAVVTTMRGNTVRVISLRPATNQEIRKWREVFHHG